jgi:ATP/maltotriose-dependent transcriptional regulator MalT
LAEAYGLWRERHWAEWLAAVSATIYIPVEIHEIVKHPSWREVLALVASGLSDQEIAEQLVLSHHTVHRHVANIRHKLGRGSRTAAVAEAARLGLL